MKGIAKNGTVSNIKPMEGGGAIASLSGGQYVYGDLSPTGSDIINFTHYYKVDGTKVLLLYGVPPILKQCKVTVANLILEDVPEPTTDPEPDPETSIFPDWFIWESPQGVRVKYIFDKVIE